MTEIVLINDGHLPKAVLVAAMSSGMTVRAIYDDQSERWGQTLYGVPFVGAVSQANALNIPGVIACDDPRRRKEIADQLDLKWGKIVHPFSTINPSAKFGPGTIILAGAILQPDVVIGKHTMISANVTIAHDCVIGDFVQLEPGVVLAGSVRIDDGAWLQIGACVIPCVQIGAGSSVGPRAVAIRDIPFETEVAGLPAMPV